MNTSLSLDFDGDAHFHGFTDRHITEDYNTSFPPLQAFIEATSASKTEMDEKHADRSDLADSEIASTLPSDDCSRSTSFDDQTSMTLP